MNIRPMTSKDKGAIMRILQNTSEFTPAEVVLADEVISDYLFNPAESGYFILVAEVDSCYRRIYCLRPYAHHRRYLGHLLDSRDRNSQGRGIGKD